MLQNKINFPKNPKDGQLFPLVALPDQPQYKWSQAKQAWTINKIGPPSESIPIQIFVNSNIIEPSYPTLNFSRRSPIDIKADKDRTILEFYGSVSEIIVNKVYIGPKEFNPRCSLEHSQTGNWVVVGGLDSNGVMIKYSTDEGQTWQESTINGYTGVQKQTRFNWMVEGPNGRLVAITRDGDMATAYSDDGGITWNANMFAINTGLYYGILDIIYSNFHQKYLLIFHKGGPLRCFFSEDGINWTEGGNLPFSGTTNVRVGEVVEDPETGVIYFINDINNSRHIGRSLDFGLTWEKSGEMKSNTSSKCAFWCEKLKTVVRGAARGFQILNDFSAENPFIDYWYMNPSKGGYLLAGMEFSKDLQLFVRDSNFVSFTNDMVNERGATTFEVQIDELFYGNIGSGMLKKFNDKRFSWNLPKNYYTNATNRGYFLLSQEL